MCDRRRAALTEHDGRSEMDTAMAEENRERTAAAVVNFMVNVVGDGYSS